MKRTRRPCWQAQIASAIARCVLPVPDSPLRMIDSRSSIQEPSARAAIVAWGTEGLSEAEVLEPLEQGEAGVEQAPPLPPLGPLLHLRLEQGRQVGERRLLLAQGLGGERAEAPPHRRQVQLGRVRLDEGLERRDLRLRAHRLPPRLRSAS